jgi:uncharacterized protein
MTREDVSSLRQIYSAMVRWDFGRIIEAVAHDIEWNLPEAVPWGGTRHGHDGLEAMLDAFRDHVDGSWADADDFLDAGDRVVVLGRMHGRARSTGQEFEVEFAHVWGMTDGVPSWFRAYYDTEPILATLEERGAGA